MKQKSLKPLLYLFSGVALFLFSACQKDIESAEETIAQSDNPVVTSTSVTAVTEAILLAIDEESIDNGNPPNNFSETDVNDQIASLSQRQTLRYFRENTGRTITLYSGEVGDEGWHAIKTIPASWISAGPTGNGARNYLAAGPGLGSGEGPEVLLDKIPNVTPLRARGLKMLTGKTILAVVYDGDVSINYGPLNGSLKGETLGLVALEVVSVVKRTDGSSGSLPKVTVKIVRVDDAGAAALKLFNNAPVPRSSSEPYDINPPANIPAIVLTDAR